jgi:chromosome segregation ATPase
MASAFTFNFSGLNSALTLAKHDAVETAATLISLQRAMDMRPSPTLQKEHIKQETALMKKINGITTELERLQSDLQSGLKSVGSRSRVVQKLSLSRGTNVMQMDAKESNKLERIRERMSSLSEELEDLNRDLKPISAAAALESEAFALEAKEISKMKDKIHTLQQKLDRHLEDDLDKAISMMSKPWRKRDNNNNNNNNGHGSPRRPSGGATRRRHRKRNVTRRR